MAEIFSAPWIFWGVFALAFALLWGVGVYYKKKVDLNYIGASFLGLLAIFQGLAILLNFFFQLEFGIIDNNTILLFAGLTMLFGGGYYYWDFFKKAK